MIPTVLAIDTASDICSVALKSDDLSLIASSEIPKRHAGEVLTLIQQLLTRVDLKLEQLALVAVVSGPGSFTGLRIGNAVAQGLAFGAKLSVTSVSAMAMIARAACHHCGPLQTVDVCLHAREDEFYYARYQDLGHESPVTLISDRICSASEVLALISPPATRTLAGAGWSHPSLHSVPQQSDLILPELITNAMTLAELALQAFDEGRVFDQPELALPSYLKDDLEYRSS
jgi:tRNA threonylcarbamoyladenosine biosynthesis protein TsaB